MGASKLTKYRNRLYADFFMPPRFTTYEAMLSAALHCGYEVHNVSSFWRLVSASMINPKTRYLILRHDIDTDRGAVEEFWKIENKLGLKASYYFRLSTLDIPWMQQIEQCGSEASYHYEEISTVAKEKALKDTESIQREMAFIRERFKLNLESLRARSGLPMTTVASHGDFINRRI
ncbi:MAG: hypothetical protein EHM70_16620, partial [Chloroflexota bacterium]